jgi:CubicO group peptidase (beta-lactamase class C family)
MPVRVAGRRRLGGDSLTPLGMESIPDPSGRGGGNAMKVDAEAAGFDEKRLERITEHFEGRYVSTGKIAGCQITVARGDHVAYHRSIGLMDRERNKPITEDTIWRIYSMTKPITSVALMQLYEKGQFLLTDPVHRYIPSWEGLRVGTVKDDGTIDTVECEQPITVRDALMHMTGLPSFMASVHPIDRAFTVERRDAGSGATLESVCEILSRHPLKFQPGTRWSYGLSTDICARLVEVLSGQTFDEYLRTEIFEPLGMADTAFFVPDDKLERFAANYNRKAGAAPQLGDDPETSNYRRRPSYFSGAGGLVSTTPDYLRFCRMLVERGELEGHRILGRKTLELMTVNHLPDNADLTTMAVGGFGEAGFTGVGFGLGFAVGQGPAATAMAGSAGEYYWGGAASTAFWIDPTEDLAVVFMTQLMPSASYPFRAQLRSLVYQALAD